MISLGNKRSSIFDQAESNCFVFDGNPAGLVQHLLGLRAITAALWQALRVDHPGVRGDRYHQLHGWGIHGIPSWISTIFDDCSHIFSIQIVIYLQGTSSIFQEISMICPVFIGDLAVTFHDTGGYLGVQPSAAAADAPAFGDVGHGSIVMYAM